MAFMSILVVGFLSFLLSGRGSVSAAASAGGGGNMEEEELFGLFEVMGSLLADPTWAEMHPLPCTDTPWPGIECGLMEETLIFHVTKLHVADDVISPPCKASAKISPSLLKLPYLRTLSLIKCFTESQVSLTKSLFLSLSSLEHLTLDSNPTLTGEIPPALSHLSSLKTLRLSQNNLTGQIPKQIGSLSNLQQLVLSRNKLTGPIPAEIGSLKTLTILDLSSNYLSQTVPFSIGDLTLVEKIDLSNNKLEGPPPPEMGKLKNLVLLDFSHNHFVGPIPETLSRLQNLQYLIMEGNPVNSTIPSFISYLANLTVLSLSSCGLHGPIPNVFSNLKNLTALSLDDNKLNGEVPTELGFLKHLDTLNLSKNHLTGQLLFDREFMNRIGQRLDFRDNDGLCANHGIRMSNASSRFLQNPTCAGAVLPAGRNKTLADKDSDRDEDFKPDLYGGSWSLSHRGLDGKVVLFCGLVLLLFVIVFV